MGKLQPEVDTQVPGHIWERFLGRIRTLKKNPDRRHWPQGLYNNRNEKTVWENDATRAPKRAQSAPQSIAKLSQKLRNRFPKPLRRRLFTKSADLHKPAQAWLDCMYTPLGSSIFVPFASKSNPKARSEGVQKNKHPKNTNKCRKGCQNNVPGYP